MSRSSPYGPSPSDPQLPPIHMPMEHQFKPGDRFTHIRERSIVQVIKCINDSVYVVCIKCHRPTCNKQELDYSLEYFDRVFNPIADVELPE